MIFDKLALEKQNSIYAEIVKSAGKSNPKISALMKNLSRAGRGLIFVSIALSAYAVATAENKFDAAGKEVVITGSGTGLWPGRGIYRWRISGIRCSYDLVTKDDEITHRERI